MWTVQTIPWHKSRRWYTIKWCGSGTFSFLKDGRSWGAYKYKSAATARCNELNKEGYRPAS